MQIDYSQLDIPGIRQWGRTLAQRVRDTAIASLHKPNEEWRIEHINAIRATLDDLEMLMTRATELGVDIYGWPLPTPQA